jgi:hypothetical protein
VNISKHEYVPAFAGSGLQHAGCWLAGYTLHTACLLVVGSWLLAVGRWPLATVKFNFIRIVREKDGLIERLYPNFVG